MVVLSRANFKTVGCPEVDLHEPRIQRRRSERIAQSVPIVIRGMDLLGQPFEERTATLSFNLHGCRYCSKHHLPKNTWVTLEPGRGSDLQNVRARVAWIQRPHSVREFFQVALEFESPQNIWAFEPAPSDWVPVEADSVSRAAGVRPDPDRPAPESSAPEIPNAFGVMRGNSMTEISGVNPVSESAASEAAPGGPQIAESPLFRELSAELERRARQAVDEATARASEQVRKLAEETREKQSWMSEESFRKWKEEFEQVQTGARERLSAQQNQLVAGIRSEFEEGLSQARRLIEEIEKNREALRAENEAAAEEASRVAQARLQLEALEATRSSPAGTGTKPEVFSDEAAAKWRERLQGEMSVAQSQWNELLQSSLDGGVRRIAGQLSERSQDIVREAEHKMLERLNELRQPFLRTVSDAHETLDGVKAALDQELARAKVSLAEVERSTSGMAEFPGRIEAAKQESLNELNRRLQTILDAQTQELGGRAETLVQMAAEKTASALDALGRKLVESTAADLDAKIRPGLERAQEVLRELSSREMQAEEGLRLHRERLRQVSANSERELVSYIGLAVAEARKDFEAARHEAVAKCSEELDASGVRASRAAGEAMEKASQGIEQEARARLQTAVEQTLAAAGTSLDERSSAVKQEFASDLDAESSAQTEKIRQQLDGFTSELTGKARTQIEQAAEVTAAAFGQVLRGISDQEVEHFTTRSLDAMHARIQELEGSASQLLRNFETSAESSLARFHAQIAAHLETSVVEGRSSLAAEFNSVLAGYRSERDAHQKDWLENLERLTNEATGRYQERLDTTRDSWMVSSVRRLNEHGQNVIESLMRSADQALRDSCARFFDGLAETLRERSIGFANRGFPSNAAHEAAEVVPPSPPAESGLNQPNF
jgi:hypothetical protein